MNVWYVFILNFLINLIVTKTTSFLVKEKGRFFLLSAVFAAELSVYKLVVPLDKVGQIICQVGLVVVFSCICFEFVTFKKFLQIFASYFVSFLLYGGLGLVLGIYLQIESVVLIFVAATGLCFSVGIILKHSRRRKMVGDFCFQTKLKTATKSLECKAFLDTGNFLFDPLTNKPVSLVNFKVLTSLFKEISLEDVLLRSEKLKSLKNAHYIPFKTLNGKDRILVFEVDEIFLNGKTVKDVMLGLCLNNFNSSFGSDIILHNDFANAIGGV